MHEVKARDFRVDRLEDGSFRITKVGDPLDRHTHCNSKKQVEVILSHVRESKFNPSLASRTLRSIQRLTTNEELSAKIEQLLLIRKNRNSQKYANVPVSKTKKKK